MPTYGFACRYPQLQLNTFRISQPKRMRGRQTVAEPRFVATDAFAQPLEEDDGGMATSRAAWAWRTDKARMMLRFIGPALILPLADPLMSVIDTICVGKVRLFIVRLFIVRLFSRSAWTCTCGHSNACTSSVLTVYTIFVSDLLTTATNCMPSACMPSA